MSEPFGQQRPQFTGPPEIPWTRIRPYVPWAVVVIAVVWVLATSIYQVDADTEGVVLRFGRIVDTTGPGLHAKLPFGIDRVERVRVKRVQTLEIGFHTVRAGKRTIYERTRDEERASAMLTGDINAALVEWIVQYRPNDPEAYLFRVVDVQETIEVASEAMMRRLVGDRSVDEVITTGREEVAQEMKAELQKLVDQYDCGVEIVTVKLQNVTPPEKVKEAFDGVNKARQEKDRVKNEAEGERNRLIPQARGDRERKVREAEGYAKKVVAEAKGRSAAFLAKWNAYKQAPEATHQRLYIEALETALAGSGRKVIVDDEMKGLLPLLNLDEKGGAR